MQDLVTDTLASKRFPAASRMNSLPRLVADYAKAIRTDHAPVTAGSAMTKSAMPRRSSARATPAAGIELDRVYTGPMVISGTLSADNGQNGNWSGTLKATLYVTVDAAGNGTGYEHFSGDITLHVGDKSSSSLLQFDTPTFSLKNGNFDYPSGFFSYEGLSFTLDVKGSFQGAQQTISEHLSLPFVGSVNGVGVSGSLHGDSLVKTPPLTIAGSQPSQSSYAASQVMPFENTIVSDLSGTTVTATVTLSKATNGTLTNLAGGTYNRKTGVYTISGSGDVVAGAIEGLTFVSAGNLGSAGHAVTTGFTLKVTDGAGATRSVGTSVSTRDPLSIGGILPRVSTTGIKAVNPFHAVTIGDSNGAETDTIRIVLSDPSNGTLKNLSGGIYNKKTGAYLLHASAANAMSALRALEFDPTKSSASGVVTTFTITVTNSAGAFITNARTTVTAKSAAGVTAHAGTALFSQYVALGLHGANDKAAALSARHEPQAHPLSELAVSHR